MLIKKSSVITGDFIIQNERIHNLLITILLKDNKIELNQKEQHSLEGKLLLNIIHFKNDEE